MNLLCLKIWLGRNVPYLPNYCMVWSNFEIDELWERNWRERERRERRKVERERNIKGGTGLLCCVYGGLHYP